MIKRANRLGALASFMLAGCQAGGSALPPLDTVSQVELQRFMGDWFVIASIPTYPEKHAYNAVESYSLEDDGSIGVIFTFRDRGFNGESKRYTPRGFVTEHPSNAIWQMQFLWPFKADYRISYLSADYAQTIVSRTRRDYVWIMARTPSIPDADYQHLLGVVASQGYDTAAVRKVPQQW